MQGLVEIRSGVPVPVRDSELPGIVHASYAMPDVHWGYGFPIGGVAATDIAGGGRTSPACGKPGPIRAVAHGGL